MRPTPRAPRQPARRRLTASLAACAATLALGLAGCTGDDDEPDSTTLPSGSGGADLPDAAPVQLQVKGVWGRWPGPGSKQSDQLAKRAGSAVTGWMDKAFLDLDYPTGGGSGNDAQVGAAFATFTSGAAQQARRQVDLTTNVIAGRDLVDVVATRRVVRLIGYAPRGTAVGVTAAVTLVLVGADADGKKTETAVTGELYLTRVRTGWRVFGYDLQRSTGAPGSYARAHRDDGKPGKTRDKPGDKPGNGGGGGR